MIRPQQFTILLIQMIYGTAFSLCSLMTMGELFYRKIRHKLLFPLIAGAVYGLAAFLMTVLTDAYFPTGLYVLHTAAAFLLVTDRRADSFLSLICAELFSVCLLYSMQTAAFSVARGAERSFVQVTLLYIGSYVLATGFVLLLTRLVYSEDRETLGTLPMLLLTGITVSVTVLIGRSFGSGSYVPDVSPEAAIPSLLLMISVTVLLLLSVKQQQARHFRELYKLGETYMTAQARHFEQTRAADTEMRMLRHDMKGHITVLNGLYEAGKTEELGAYLKELGTAFAETQAVTITGNEIADAILSEKMALAGSAGLQLSVDGSLQGLSISAVTLCTVLSDLLDNAIEAAEQTEGERCITLTARRTGSFYYIRICNPCVHAVDVSANLVTSKSDSRHHGLGLKSVRNVLEKCGGTLELSCKEAAAGWLFTAEVILPSE